MSGELTYRSEDAVKGGFQSIRAFEGLFTEMGKVDGKFENDQARLNFEDVIILEMEEGEPEPDLQDGRFGFYCNFAKKGKSKPNVNSFYVKGLMKSAEALAKARGNENGDVRDLFNTRVVMRKKTIDLFPGDKDPETGEREMVKGTNFVFDTDDGGSQVGVEDYVKGLLVGKNKSNALRSLMGDSRTKGDPKWRNGLNSGSLIAELGLKIGEDGVIVEQEKAEAPTG